MKDKLSEGKNFVILLILSIFFTILILFLNKTILLTIQYNIISNNNNISESIINEKNINSIFEEIFNNEVLLEKDVINCFFGKDTEIISLTNQINFKKYNTGEILKFRYLILNPKQCNLGEINNKEYRSISKSDSLIFYFILFINLLILLLQFQRKNF